MSPTSLGEDDGGFTNTWVGNQEQQLGPLQSTDDTRREIQEMPPIRPPVDDDEESEFCVPKKIEPKRLLVRQTKEGAFFLLRLACFHTAHKAESTKWHRCGVMLSLPRVFLLSYAHFAQKT